MISRYDPEGGQRLGRLGYTRTRAMIPIYKNEGDDPPQIYKNAVPKAEGYKNESVPKTLCDEFQRLGDSHPEHLEPPVKPTPGDAVSFAAHPALLTALQTKNTARTTHTQKHIVLLVGVLVTLVVIAAVWIFVWLNSGETPAEEETAEEEGSSEGNRGGGGRQRCFRCCTPVGLGTLGTMLIVLAAAVVGVVWVTHQRGSDDEEVLFQDIILGGIVPRISIFQDIILGGIVPRISSGIVPRTSSSVG